MERIEPEAAEGYFLQNAAPEAVYEYLGQHFVLREHVLDEPLSAKIQKSLLARGQPIIDLALAQFAGCDEVIFELLSRDDRDLRIAVLSNKNRFFTRLHLDQEESKGLLPDEIFQKLIQQGSLAELQAFFRNPGFKEHALADVFARKDLYADLSDKRWQVLVNFAFLNPNLESDPDLERFDDGWRRYRKSMPFTEAYKLPLQVEPSPMWAAVLEDGISRLGSWSPAEDLAAEMAGEKMPEDTGSTEWKEARDRGERLYLETVFERWKTPKGESDKRTQRSVDRWGTSFDGLREAAASRVPHFKSELIGWMLEHSDRWVRRGAYQKFRPDDVEQIERYYERDGRKHFLEPAAMNSQLYSNTYAEAAAISRKFHDLVYYGERHRQDDSDYDYAEIDYERELDRLHRQWPDAFPKSPDDFLKWEEEAGDQDSSELVQQKLDHLRSEISELSGNVSSQGELQELSRMVDSLSDMIVQQTEGLRASARESEEGLIVRLNEIARDAASVPLLLKVAAWAVIIYGIVWVLRGLFGGL